MHDKSFKRKAFNDCFRIMIGSITFSICYELIVVVVQTVSANTIGAFANAIISLKNDLVMNNLWILIILVLINIILEPLVGVIKNIFLFKQAINHHGQVVSKFLNKDYLKAQKFNSGELSSRWEIDILNYRTTVIAMISKPIIILVSFILVSFYIFNNFAYGIVCMIAAIVPVITTYFTSSMESRYFMRNYEYEAERRVQEIDLSTEHSYLKMNQVGKYFLKNIDDLFQNYFKEVGVKEINLKSTITFCNSISNYAAQITVVLFGTYLLSKGRILPGDIVSYLGYLLPIQRVMKEGSEFIRQVRIYNGVSQRIVEFYIDCENIDGKDFECKISEIECKNISFSYDNSKTIINDVSLRLDEKKKILIYGENGCGKSTLIKLISGLYSGYKGDLNINKENNNSFNIDSIRSRISYIDQSPYFFKGTLEENVRIVNPEVTQEKMQMLLNKLKINKPLNYEIKDDGSNLSGGEKQKLSIVRGLIRDADVYVLDEPTNNLDIQSKGVIKSIIEEQKNTVILITHDTDIQMVADKKILMVRGGIISNTK